jgi:excinuclease UvrABC helicase subunit UvrB
VAPEDGDNISLRQYIERLIDERDRLYNERHANSLQAIKDALLAQKELTNAAFAASKEAILKAEQSQNSYNAGHNDLMKKMDKQYSEMIPRSTFEQAIKSIEDKINDLRESRSANAGAGTGKAALWAYVLGGAGLLMSLVSIIVLVVKMRA